MSLAELMEDKRAWEQRQMLLPQTRRRLERAMEERMRSSQDEVGGGEGVAGGQAGQELPVAPVPGPEGAQERAPDTADNPEAELTI